MSDPAVAANVEALAAEEAAINDDAVDDSATRVGSKDVTAAIRGLNDPDSGFYSSIKGNDFEARKSVVKAMTSSKPVKSVIGTTLNLVNVIVLPVDLLSEDTGEVNTAPRCILITAEGDAYHATSIGILTAIQQIFAGVGEPETWPAPLPVIPVRAQGNGKWEFFTLNLP